MRRTLPLISMLFLWFSSTLTLVGQVDTSASQFVVPQFAAQMATLDRLHKQHQQAAFTDCTLWDRWLPHATLWTGTQPRLRYRASLLNRRIDSQGYVAMQQHRGMAHSDGWPFPAWQQSTGHGFHFSTQHEAWALQHFQLTAATDTSGWQFAGVEVMGIDPNRGLQLQIREPVATITTPKFRCGTIVAPFVRLELAADEQSLAGEWSLRWLLEGEPNWSTDRRVSINISGTADQMTYENVPLFRQTEYAGMVTQYQIELRAKPGSRIDLKSMITAIDTRHPITNSNYLRACVEYFSWTQDHEFLRLNLPRMRLALAYLIEEFSLLQQHHVVVPWVGHDGRSGLVFDAAGKKQLRPGLGVGNNYWDLLPFGGHDA